ncbi:MAG: cytochrome c biogenesis protein ResB [Akkermansiaceae bacterium]|nr:cytochrome c biogenesis protein ResB [Akkermansiaceae bacterium]
MSKPLPAVRLLKPLASAAIFYYATLWLVVLVVVGTINQKYFGLHYSLEKYFSAWCIQPMEWPLWLPGGRLIMAVILVNLTAKLLVGTKWKFQNIGINITHLGVFLLMVGAVVTAYTTTEGHISIREGEESSTFLNSHEVELAVTDRSNPEYDDTTSFTQGFFHSKQPFGDDTVPMAFKVTRMYKNCKPVARPDNKKSDKFRGRAANVELEELPGDPKDQNLRGIEVEITGLPDDQSGSYIFIAHPEWKPAILTAGDGKTYEVSLRARHHQLPFSLYLKDFEKLNHAGTMMARAFSSKVRVTQDESTEDIKIYMNHPLRRNGYTLYQASFSQVGVETTVLQVVYNKGQLMPYISIVVITLGLLVHVVMQVPRLIVAAQNKNQPRKAS